MEHAVAVEETVAVVETEDRLSVGWIWTCSCGKRAQRSWLNKYDARHAGENHRIRERNRNERRQQAS
jgi:hypothetical protein